MLINVNNFFFYQLYIIKQSYSIITNRIMNEKYNVYLISDSTGETLDRIFLSLSHSLKILNMIKKSFFL